MNKKELNFILQEGEGIKIELKPSLSDINRIVETVCSFANSKGGTVFIGVLDNGNICGINIGRQTIERLTNTIVDNLDPKIYPEIKPHIIGKKGMISIKVEESSDKPHLAFGKAFIRVGKNTKAMSRGEYEKQLLEKHEHRLQFDIQVCKEATLKDIDRNRLERFLKKAKQERNLKISFRLPLRDALEKLKLTRDNKLTNAAVLLFGLDPLKFFLQAEIRCARFKGIEAIKPFIDMQVIGGSILEQIEEAERFVLRNISKSAWLEPWKVERQEKWEYPPDAVREAITNAVCHRDYRSSANVQVRIFDDRLEIWNPGGLPEGWTVEKLKIRHESKPHNPLVADCFFLVKLIERWGTGTVEMVKWCKKENLPEPEFEDTGSSIVVTFRKSRITEDLLEKMELSERQIGAIKYLKEHKNISRSTYAKLSNCSTRTALGDLVNLLDKGVVIRSGKGKKVVYSLA